MVSLPASRPPSLEQLKDTQDAIIHVAEAGRLTLLCVVEASTPVYDEVGLA